MYLYGFGNHHQSEAVPGALPERQNSPQQAPHNLYAEQLSGSAFTRPRHLNLHSWLYRKRPSTSHGPYIPYSHIDSPFAALQEPNPLRWSPLPAPNAPLDFIDGLVHMAGNALLSAYVYQCNQSMLTRYFTNCDGELLIVPYEGDIRLRTELGILDISPGMIAVIPRGIVFKVELHSATAAGYLCENRGTPLTLPSLGIMGANGLANPRHFFYPKAAVEDREGEVKILCKYQQHGWISACAQSPLNVMAWHGNYAPFAYDLSLFNTINTVSFDHPDPSIFTVLTSESDTVGVANLDLVIFPPRWMVAEHTFRPAYFHRNIMSELMGLIRGEYDAKKVGFEIGGVSIHNAFVPHGPDAAIYQQASQQKLKPDYYANTLAFMLESKNTWQITDLAMIHPTKQLDYSQCWDGL